MGWVLLKIGRNGLEDGRWERDCLAEEGQEDEGGLDAERFVVRKRRGESCWAEELSGDEEEEEEGQGVEGEAEADRTRTSEE